MLSFFNKSFSLPILKFLTILGLSFYLSFGLVLTQVFAQTSTNPINLGITVSIKDGQKTNNNRTSPTSWEATETLNIDDSVGFTWQGVDLALKYKETPAREGGWLKVYLESVEEQNLLTEAGTDNYPLKFAEFADKLQNGSNTLQFVYTNSFSLQEFEPISYTFTFVRESTAPDFEIIKPSPGTVFMNGVEKEILIELSNFQLSTIQTENPNLGTVMIYLNAVEDQNFLAQLTSGSFADNGLFQSRLDSTTLNLDRFADNSEAKLIFVLTDIEENPLGIQKELPILLNYENSLDVGLPRVSIVEPKKDRQNLSVNKDTRFILSIENFELLRTRPTTSEERPDNNKAGFLQIIISSSDKSEPIKPMWDKTDFSLAEIGYYSPTEGLKTVKVQLVDQSFDLLAPEAVDTIEIFYEPENLGQQNTEVEAQQNTWRIVIIAMTVLLIVGGISVLITKG